MSARYDPLMARALAREVLARWKGTRISSLRMDRARRAVELVFEDDSRLVALLHPLHGYIFAVAADSTAVLSDTSKLKLGRLSLAEASAPPDERALLLTFADRHGRPWDALAIELQTQRWNALHLRVVEDDEAAAASEPAGPPADPALPVEWRIDTALISRDAGERPLRRGAVYSPPQSTRLGIAAAPSEADWLAALPTIDQTAEPEDHVADRRRTVLQTWAWTSTLNVDWVLSADPEPAAYARFLALRDASSDALGATSSWILDRRWGLQPYPHPLESGEETSDGLLGSLASIVEKAGGASTLLGAMSVKDEARAGSEQERLAKRLRSRGKRLAKRLAALERQLEAAGPPDEPRAIGQLLLARKSDVPKGASTITLEDFDGSKREIRLDPTSDLVANAERFFDEARRRERALDRLPGEISKAKDRAAHLEAAAAGLAESGPSAELWDLVGGKPTGGPSRRANRSEAESRLPYSRLVSSGGLEIRVGRGPKDNDDLTFHHSAPDDIWLHASQASGAHVILRWGRKDGNPPRRDLLEAAIAAAVNSGARHAGTVPVVWTKRKHVRKPRKSPPGTVTPGHAQTLFVKPDPDLVKSLHDDRA